METEVRLGLWFSFSHSRLISATTTTASGSLDWEGLEDSSEGEGDGEEATADGVKKSTKAQRKRGVL